MPAWIDLRAPRPAIQCRHRPRSGRPVDFTVLLPNACRNCFRKVLANRRSCGTIPRMPEQRKHTRRDARYRVLVSAPGSAAGAETDNTLCCSTADIALGGLRFKSDVPFVEGQMVNLEIILGSAFWGYSFKGRVAWVRTCDTVSPFEVGIEFVDTPLATRLAWEEAISRDLPSALI
jgi:hypothetical protein